MIATLSLENLPNIGSALAKLLKDAGINLPAELYDMDSLQAFLRMKAIDKEAFLSKLYALEGTVEGIRWHSLTKTKKEKLKRFFSMLNS